MAEIETTSVWVVEDQRVFRESLRDIVATEEGLECRFAFESAEDFFAALEHEDPPDLVLMDIGLPGASGIEAVRHVTSLSPQTRVIILTIHEEDEKVFEAMCAGASGYLLKPSGLDSIVTAIREVQLGAAPINPYIARKMLGMFQRLSPPKETVDTYGLTPREREILQKLVDGLTLKKIAAELGLSYHTISNHLRNVYSKLHVRSRSSAVAKALREELL